MSDGGGVRRLVLKIVRLVAGGVLTAAGVVGCLLPILPGIPFLILGLGLLSIDIPLVRRARDRAAAYLHEQRTKLRQRRMKGAERGAGEKQK